MNSRKNNSKLISLIFYATYVTLIILISTVYIAETEFRGKIDEINYRYDLTFEKDGKLEHYDVVRTNPNEPGYISVHYISTSNQLKVNTVNIKSIKIDCRSIAQEKSNEILGKVYYDDTNAYKQYFIDKEKFNVIVDSDYLITISFIDVPFPYSVIVNDQILTERIDYTYIDGRISTIVPKGHSEVLINFVTNDKSAPKARFSIQYEYLIPNAPLTFNASISRDDGIIKDYFWDFGDGSFESDVIVTHSFDVAGDYRVILTVRDNDDLIDSISRMVSVGDVNNNSLPDGWEHIYRVSDPDEDEDDDGLNNIGEYTHGTYPNNPDSDEDGYSDGIEVEKGTDPMDSSDYPKEKKEQEEFAQFWPTVAAVTIIIVLLLLIVVLVVQSYKVKKMKRKALKRKAGTKGTSHKTIRKKTPVHAFERRKPTDYIASTIPKEVLQPKNPTEPKPKLPFQNPPKLQDLKIEKQNLNNRMLDTDLRVPVLGTKVVYECPTCESPIGEADEFCQNCGQQFED